VARVLIVEDNRNLAHGLRTNLEFEGHRAEIASDGDAGLRRARSGEHDIVVLDLMLPELDGYRVLETLRREGHTVPVLVLTARGDEADKVRGLDSGADDYVTKPFQMEEVIARVRALIRRAHGRAQPELKCGRLALDPRSARVTVDGTPVSLTSHEFRVLSYLMHQNGRVVSRGELTEHIYAQDFDRDSNTVEVFIARLRRKLGPAIIETVRGLGYRIAAAPSTAVES